MSDIQYKFCFSDFIEKKDDNNRKIDVDKTVYSIDSEHYTY